MTPHVVVCDYCGAESRRTYPKQRFCPGGKCGNAWWAEARKRGATVPRRPPPRPWKRPDWRQEAERLRKRSGAPTQADVIREALTLYRPPWRTSIPCMDILASLAGRLGPMGRVIRMSVADRLLSAMAYCVVGGLLAIYVGLLFWVGTLALEAAIGPTLLGEYFHRLGRLILGYR